MVVNKPIVSEWWVMVYHINTHEKYISTLFFLTVRSYVIFHFVTVLCCTIWEQRESLVIVKIKSKKRDKTKKTQNDDKT